MVLTSPSRLACWFRADTGTYQDSALTIPAVNDGDPVGGWADQSGNGFSALQGGTLNRPSLRLNQLNGLPAIQFNSAQLQFLSLGAVLGKPRAWSLFVVMSTASPSARQCPHGSVSATGATASSWGNAPISQQGLPVGSSSPDFGDSAGQFSQSVTAANIWSANVFNLMSYVHKDNDAAIAVFKNGSPLATTQGASAAFQASGFSGAGFSLGREGDYNLAYLNGMISEFILYDASLWQADRSTVESYLKTRYGL